MNSSQFMDKQIMDLSRSQSNNNNDSTIFDLLNPQQEEKKHSSSSDYSVSGAKKEDILPSYDFQPIRPISGSGGSGPVNLGGSNVSGTRVWSSADSKPNSSARNHNYLDREESSKRNEGGYDATILSEIDRTMKKHADLVLHSLEGVSARLSQMESRSRNLESLVDDLKVSVESNAASDGKLRQLENILREVQSGVEALRDKQQEVAAEAPKAKHTHSSTAQPESVAPPLQAVPQQVVPYMTLGALSPAVEPRNRIPSSSEHYYFPPPGQLPDPTQQYLSPAPPQFPPSEPPQAQAQAAVPAVVVNHPHLEQTHHPPGHQSYLRQSSVAAPPPQSQQYYGGAPAQMYEPRPPGYGGGGPPSHYMMMKQQQQLLSSSPSAPSSGSYPRLPTSQVLPHALPAAAAGGGSDSSSGGGGGRVPIDDVVEKVATMGFSREQVRATVRKLTENGQSVDLNVVLDTLMNDGEIQQQPQNQKAWFGR